MIMKDRTKIMFAETLKEMLLETSMEKIRVTELCRKCGATPPTFYYYFHDKYELVAWIFLQDFSAAYNRKMQGYSPATIANALRIMSENKVFYQKAYNESSQNSIDKYIQDFNIKLSTDSIMQRFPNTVISKDMLLTIRYHSYGIMGLFQDWINARITTSGTDFAKFLYEQTPALLKEAFASRTWE